MNTYFEREGFYMRYGHRKPPLEATKKITGRGRGDVVVQRSGGGWRLQNVENEAGVAEKEI